MLQKISISNKYGSFELSIQQRKQNVSVSTKNNGMETSYTFFNTMNILSVYSWRQHLLFVLHCAILKVWFS